MEILYTRQSKIGEKEYKIKKDKGQLGDIALFATPIYRPVFKHFAETIQ
jgi:hypothetical protein